MLYIERQPSTRSVVLLATLAPALYLLGLAFLEMRSSDEGLHAAIVREMIDSGDYLKTHLYGRPIKGYPLYCWLVALFSGFRAPTPFTLRLPSVFSVWGLALLCGFSARRYQTPFAGFIAACVVILSLVGLQCGLRAHAEFLQAFLMACAWAAWYHFGIDGKRWPLAWGLSHGLLFFAILNGGFKSLFWFYLPFFFMPRQFNMRMRMQMPSHLVSGLFLLFGICVWLWITPDQPLVPWNQEDSLKLATATQSNYLWHLIVFPCKVIYYLIPWSVLLWAPFCIALRQFEHQPYLGKYLRAIVLTIFFVVWLWPGTSPLVMLPLLGPIAMLIGMHFEIVLRRYQHFLSRIVHDVSWFVIAGNALAIIFWSLVAMGAIVISGFQLYHAYVFMGLLVIMAVVIWFVILKKNTHCTFRTSVIWCIAATFVLCLCTVREFINWRMADKRHIGQRLAGITASAQQTQPTLQHYADKVKHIYYRPSSDKSNLYLTEFFYLGKPIKMIRQRDDWSKAFPENEETVVVICEMEPPIPSRKWTALSDPVVMNFKRHSDIVLTTLNIGSFPWYSIERVNEDNPSEKRLQLFQGTLLEK